METFDNEYKNHLENRPILSSGEHILWSGKPKKNAFVTAHSFTLMPIAVIWFCLDSQVFPDIFSASGIQWFLVGFFALHLAPVWIWLGSVITAPKRWRNTNYYVTNRRIIIQGGFLATNEKSLFYKDIRSVQSKVGIFDKLFGTGTIVFNSEMMTNNNNKATPPSFQYLEDAQQIYARIQRTVLDMQTDMEFPNAYRPEDNPGYKTDYKW